MEGFVKYAVQMTSGGIIYIPSFIQISYGVQNLFGRMHTESKMIS
jgi:hypothetical protein